MPKVSDDYLQNKKKLIVDAAYNLCLRKTVSTVTMQDIINETGFSQGGIYRFYHDIDEIFHDMLIDMRSRVSIKKQVDQIFLESENLPQNQITTKIFDMLADFMTKELMGIEKVDFELSILAMNAPKRIDKITSNISEIGHMEYLSMRTAEFFSKKMDSGELSAKVSKEELLSYIASAYSGIQMCCIVNNCYKHGPLQELYQPKIQLKTLAKTVNYLLGL